MCQPAGGDGWSVAIARWGCVCHFLLPQHWQKTCLHGSLKKKVAFLFGNWWFFRTRIWVFHFRLYQDGSVFKSFILNRSLFFGNAHSDRSYLGTGSPHWQFNQEKQWACVDFPQSFWFAATQHIIYFGPSGHFGKILNRHGVMIKKVRTITRVSVICSSDASDANANQHIHRREFMVKPPSNACDSHLATLFAARLSLSRLKLTNHPKSICFVCEKKTWSERLNFHET